MAGFVAKKSKCLCINFFWLEPGKPLLLEVEHEMLSPNEMYMFLDREKKGFQEQEILVNVIKDELIEKLCLKTLKRQLRTYKEKTFWTFWKTSRSKVPENLNKDVSSYFCNELSTYKVYRTSGASCISGMV